MKIENVAFSVTAWDRVAVTEHPGESGKALWRTVEAGNVRIRMVEYSAGYVADHWCDRGHVVLVLEGSMTTEIQGGATFALSAGQSYQVAEKREPHRSRSDTGAKLFIVD